MSTQTKEKDDILMVVLLNKRDTGWRKLPDGVLEKRPEAAFTAAKREYPDVTIIPSKSYTFVKKKFDDGKEHLVRTPIRFIKGCPTLFVEEQDKMGYKPHRRTTGADVITIQSGIGTFSRKDDPMLYEYMTKCSYYAGEGVDPDASKHLFRIAEFDKQVEDVNDFDFVAAEAVGIIGSKLRSRKGKDVVYDEDAIDALCAIFNIGSDSYAGKVSLLTQIAKEKPKEFIHLYRKSTETVVAELSNAMKFNVIKIKGGDAIVMDGEKELKVLKKLEATKKDDRIIEISNYLSLPENKQLKEEIDARVTIEMEKNL